MTEPSADNGVANGRRSGGRCKDGRLDVPTGVIGVLGEFVVGLPIKKHSETCNSILNHNKTDLLDSPFGDKGPSVRFPGLKWNLLGGIIALGSNTSGGMTR